MPKRKHPEVSQAARNVYERIVQCQKHIENVIDARLFADVNNSRDIRNDFAPAVRALREKEIHLWRVLASVGLYLPDEEQTRIKAAVHERFFSQDMVTTTDWLNCSAKEFKTALADLCLTDDIRDEVVAVMAKRKLVGGNA